MVDNFPRDSVIRRINIEPALMLGAGRALLLQLAHPAVAQGVEDHSDFRRNPFKRLQGTFEGTYAVVYGSRELADGMGRRVQWIHDFVKGQLGDGRPYMANDHTALLWVHATLLDTALLCYQQFVGPLTEDEQETYYQEMTRAAEAFGVPRDEQPADLVAFRKYFDDTVASFEVTDVGRSLMGYILRPKLPLRLDIPMAPAMSLQRLITAGTTPEPLRHQFDLTWSAKHQRKLDRASRVIRGSFNVQPRSLRISGMWLWCQTLLRKAARDVEAFEAKRAAATKGDLAAAAARPATPLHSAPPVVSDLAAEVIDLTTPAEPPRSTAASA